MADIKTLVEEAKRLAERATVAAMHTALAAQTGLQTTERYEDDKRVLHVALDALAEAHQAEVERLTRENEEMAKINAELLDQMHHFANADQRLWDESQRDPESFIRWVRSRAAHLLAKFTDRAALAGASGAQEGERT